MSQYPPQGSYPPVSPPRTSAAAVTSFVMGLLLCVPIVTQLGAILFGIIGLVATGRPDRKGRGFAVAGLVLGIVVLLGWGGLFASGGWYYVKIKPERTMVRQFVTDLSGGNVSAAKAVCGPAVTTPQLQATADQLRGYGSLVDVTESQFNAATSTGGPSTLTIGGDVTYSGGKHSFTVTMNYPSGGPAQVVAWTFN